MPGQASLRRRKRFCPRRNRDEKQRGVKKNTRQTQNIWIAAADRAEIYIDSCLLCSVSIKRSFAF
jgi:hypothetical protein